MSQAATLLRASRLRSGLSQAELARRMGTSQASIARLERPGANPTVATLRRVLRASGHVLDLTVSPRAPSVDLPQLLRHMRMTPAERLRAHQSAYDNMRALVSQAGERGRLG